MASFARQRRRKSSADTHSGTMGDQRARIVAAMVTVARDQGAQAATVARVAAEAGVSRKTFYELFTDRGDCLLAAVEDGVSRVTECAREAIDGEDAWVDRVRAGLLAVLEFCDEERALAQVCIAETMLASTVTPARRRELLDGLIEFVDEGRLSARRVPMPLVAEGVVGGALRVVQTRLQQRDPASLVELLGPLMSFIVLPYLGQAMARRELERQPRAALRRARKKPALGSRDGPETRLTYRTMRVIAVIAAQPGLSNSQISERAGITDQGQISKLLWRLACLNLIENTGLGQAKGAPNAWRLTSHGEGVERELRHERLPPRADTGGWH